MAGLNPDRAFDFLSLKFQLGNVFEIELQALGHPGPIMMGLSQVSLVSGFGSSCNQPLFEKRPS